MEDVVAVSSSFKRTKREQRTREESEKESRSQETDIGGQISLLRNTDVRISTLAGRFQQFNTEVVFKTRVIDTRLYRVTLTSRLTDDTR